MLPQYHAIATAILIIIYALATRTLNRIESISFGSIVLAFVFGVLIDLDRVPFMGLPREYDMNHIIQFYMSRSGKVPLQPLHSIEVAVPLSFVMLKYMHKIIFLSYVLHLMLDVIQMVRLHIIDQYSPEDLYAKFSILYNVLFYHRS